jgi:hypothetical protein
LTGAADTLELVGVAGAVSGIAEDETAVFGSGVAGVGSAVALPGASIVRES